MKRVELANSQNTIFSDSLHLKMHSVACDSVNNATNIFFRITSDMIFKSNAYINRNKTKYESMFTGGSYLLDSNSKSKNKATDSEDVVRIQKTVRKG